MVSLVEPSGEGCRLLVRLTPKSSRDGLDGIDTLADGRLYLKARVRAVPEKGKANAQLIKILATRLDVPASAIRIGSGATSRLKTVNFDFPAAEIEARLSQSID